MSSRQYRREADTKPHMSEHRNESAHTHPTWVLTPHNQAWRLTIMEAETKVVSA